MFSTALFIALLLSNSLLTYANPDQAEPIHKRRDPDPLPTGPPAVSSEPDPFKEDIILTLHGFISNLNPNPNQIKPNPPQSQTRGEIQPKSIKNPKRLGRSDPPNPEPPGLPPFLNPPPFIEPPPPKLPPIKFPPLITPPDLITPPPDFTLLIPATGFVQFQGEYQHGTPNFIYSNWDITFYNNGTLSFYTNTQNSNFASRSDSTQCLEKYVIACGLVDAGKWMYIIARDGKGLCYGDSQVKTSYFNIWNELWVFNDGKGWENLVTSTGNSNAGGEREMICRVRLGTNDSQEADVNHVVSRLRDSLESKYGGLQLKGESLLVD